MTRISTIYFVKYQTVRMHNWIIESGSYDSTVATVTANLNKFCPLKCNIVHYIECNDTDCFIRHFKVAIAERTPGRAHGNGFFMTRTELNACINYASLRHPELNKMDDDLDLEIKENSFPDEKKMKDTVLLEN